MVDLLSLEVSKKPAAVFPWGSRLTPVRVIDEMTQEGLLRLTPSSRRSLFPRDRGVSS